MIKTVWKLRPADNWQIGENESWLSDMAENGYHFTKMGSLFAKFVKDEPQKMKYRIEITPKNEIAYEQINMYEEHGWEYVSSFYNYHVFSSPVERNVPEIHTDSAEQSLTLKSLNKQFIKGVISLIIGTIVMLGYMLFMVFFDGTPTYNVVTTNTSQTLLILIIYIYAVVMFLKSVKSINNLRKDLLEGKSINHHASWRQSSKIHYIVSLLPILLAIVTIIIPIYEIIAYDKKTLPVEEIDVPVARLAAIEQNTVLQREEHFVDGVDFDNRIVFSWSLLAPAKYEINESGIVPGEMWNDQDGEYSPALNSDIYELRFSFLASPLIDDLVERELYFDEQSKKVELEHPGLDRIITLESSEASKYIFASKDNLVMLVRYYGYADLETVIEQVAMKMN